MTIKYTLAVLKAWEELILAKNYEPIEDLELDEEIRTRFKLEEYDIYSEFFTVMAKFINPRIFACVLVSDVAAKAGFPEFCNLSIPTQINHLDYPSYANPPEGLADSYFHHPQPWIDAFVKVRNPTAFPVCVFYPAFQGDTAPWYEVGKITDFDRVSAKLIEMEISDDDKRWENFLSGDLGSDEDESEEYKVSHENIHQRINYYLEIPLRLFSFSEKVFREPKNPKFKAPHRVKIVELHPNTQFNINYWALGLGCDFPIIEALFYSGAFDKSDAQSLYV